MILGEGIHDVYHVNVKKDLEGTLYKDIQKYLSWRLLDKHYINLSLATRQSFYVSLDIRLEGSIENDIRE